MSCVMYRGKDFEMFLDDTKSDDRKYIEIHDKYATAISFPNGGPARMIRLKLDSRDQLDLLISHKFRRVERIFVRM